MAEISDRIVMAGQVAGRVEGAVQLIAISKVTIRGATEREHAERKLAAMQAAVKHKN